LFYLAARGCTARAAVTPPGPCQTKPFPVFAAPGLTKRHVSQWSTILGAPLLWSSHIRDPWRIKSPLWALHCCGQAIFETHGASNHKLLLTSGDQVQHNSCVFSELGSRSFKSYVFSDTKIHHTPLTSKSKEQRREQTNITIETCMYKIFQKVRCTLGSLSTERSQPRRSGRSPLG